MDEAQLRRLVNLKAFYYYFAEEIIPIRITPQTKTLQRKANGELLFISLQEEQKIMNESYVVGFQLIFHQGVARGRDS